jgi:hypothetical protein
MEKGAPGFPAVNMDEQNRQDRKIGPKENPFARGENFKPALAGWFEESIQPFYPVYPAHPCENPL